VNLFYSYAVIVLAALLAHLYQWMALGQHSKPEIKDANVPFNTTRFNITSINRLNKRILKASRYTKLGLFY